MKEYIFKTQTTMKEYNRDKWWIDADIVPTIRVYAENVKQALKNYAEKVADKCYIDISNNAIKRPDAMYRDTENGTKQIGYVITGSTDFEKGNYSGWSKQFIDLWVEIIEAKTPCFE